MNLKELAIVGVKAELARLADEQTRLDRLLTDLQRPRARVVKRRKATKLVVAPVKRRRRSKAYRERISVWMKAYHRRQRKIKRAAAVARAGARAARGVGRVVNAKAKAS